MLCGLLQSDSVEQTQSSVDLLRRVMECDSKAYITQTHYQLIYKVSRISFHVFWLEIDILSDINSYK